MPEVWIKLPEERGISNVDENSISRNFENWDPKHGIFDSKR